MPPFTVFGIATPRRCSVGVTCSDKRRRRQPGKNRNEHSGSRDDLGSADAQHPADRIGFGTVAIWDTEAAVSTGSAGPRVLSLIWFAGALELVLPPLLIVGFLTRPVAFILAGEMAFAYFIGHAPRSFYPSVNGGNLAILFCLVFLYLAVAGGGPRSVDEPLRRKGGRLAV